MKIALLYAFISVVSIVRNPHHPFCHGIHCFPQTEELFLPTAELSSGPLIHSYRVVNEKIQRDGRGDPREREEHH